MDTVITGKPQGRGHWIPWLFVGGFAIIIAVNAVLIVQAVRTFSGLVVEQPYKKGIEYNAAAAQLDEQRRLGWTVSAALTPQDGGAVVELRWADRDGAPLDGLSVAGEFRRPVENLPAVPVAFTAIGGGRYRSFVALPKAGAWDLHASASRSGARFLLAERLVQP